MTPKISEILRGNFAVLARIAAGEPASEFTSAQLMTIALLDLLCAQEAERANAVVDLENQAIEDLLRKAGCDVRTAHATPDARNNELREELIRLHERAEANQDKTLERQVLQLYKLIAATRRLELPTLP